MEAQKILSLDISGSATGWAFSYKNSLEVWGKYISDTQGSKGKRLYKFSMWLRKLLREYNPDIVLIEKPFKGRNSNVFANLSKFIAVAEVEVYRTLKLEMEEVWFLDPKTIKKTLKVKKGRDHSDNKKLMVRKINSLCGLKLKYIKNKTKKYNDDDIADAIAIILAWWKLSLNTDN